VNRPGEQALAGSGLTVEHDRGVASGDLLDGFENPLHGRTLADDIFEGGFSVSIDGDDVVRI
jgi:hypothetical protein